MKRKSRKLAEVGPDDDSTNAWMSANMSDRDVLRVKVELSIEGSNNE